jgi:dCTP deaminase
MYRNTLFRKKITDLLKALKNNSSSETLISQFKKTIVKEFSRFDQSILQSIQISEWVDLFVDDKDQSENLEQKYKNTESKTQGLLVDKDIYQFLKEERIKIIPLININEQLGSTSLDIRLGTSFEVFYPNQFGIIDFTNPQTSHNIKHNSKRINLDYLDHIPINPGQFMLGHSMEYIKLPNDVSADLEGRSSFARLGIEIHMTAGFVDPGFDGVLTFEIFNAGTNPVMLYPGLRMGQLRFTIGAVPSVGYSNKLTHKYSGRLEHLFSLHGDDYEVSKIASEKEKLIQL